MRYREYDRERDEKDTLRVMGEVGWLFGGDADMRAFFDCGRSFVAELNGHVEACSFAARGTIRYLTTDLPMCSIGAVATSRVARRQGLAADVTAGTVAEMAREGILVAGLGMFDQGFYNRLGFGTGPHELHTTFDPAFLNESVDARVPVRLGKEDWELIHRNRLRRRRGHGAVNVTSPLYTKGEMLETRNGFGLGYVGEDGELTHHLWMGADNINRGPYDVMWTAWSTPQQFHELMALLEGLGDQVHAVRMVEPQGLQLQDLLDRPLYRNRLASGGRFETDTHGRADWQLRILDLPGCMEHTHLRGGPVRFNLVLHDPVEQFLDESVGWSGAGGDFVVTLGPDSSAEAGHDAALQTLAASVNAYTRLWMGILPASGLAMTDDLRAPEGLLEALDRVLCMPLPRPDWAF